jgi:hypothetical protein
MLFSALDRYYIKLFEVNLDFLLLKNVWTIWQDSTPYTLEQSVHCSIHFTYSRSELE